MMVFAGTFQNWFTGAHSLRANIPKALNSLSKGQTFWKISQRTELNGKDINPGYVAGYFERSGQIIPAAPLGTLSGTSETIYLKDPADSEKVKSLLEEFVLHGKKAYDLLYELNLLNFQSQGQSGLQVESERAISDLQAVLAALDKALTAASAINRLLNHPVPEQ